MKPVALLLAGVMLGILALAWLFVGPMPDLDEAQVTEHPVWPGIAAVALGIAALGAGLWSLARRAS